MDENGCIDKEPQIHSHYLDCLPDSHPKAFEIVDCGACRSMVHCSNNECMQTWVEWEDCALCGDCFAKYLLESEGVLSWTDFEQLAKRKETFDEPSSE